MVKLRALIALTGHFGSVAAGDEFETDAASALRLIRKRRAVRVSSKRSAKKSGAKKSGG